ncbi:MAG: prephenate dehydrogenase/arogenate dehydrogenase family protein [Desulfobacteraceae bacterium]|jgi:prephenate dehydrogenase|nr:prephenate dehydrogenase/arogenate dehydrogenase family protein [Desulfobacteraceae bacterium]
MIGIIGFGRFGALTARYLARDLAVLVLDSGAKTDAIRAVGAAPASLEEICRQEMVILCVPISALCDHLRRIASLLGPDTLVVDVCSVKALPVGWMKEILPPATPILGTHPMFGPDSAADSLAGRKIVICRERIDAGRYEPIQRWLARQGLEIIETTAEAHDRQIAVSLALTHFIGRSLAAFGAKPMAIDTEGYRRLLHILGVVENDTWQLFEDMHRFNPFARDQRQDFVRAMTDIEARLEKTGAEEDAEPPVSTAPDLAPLQARIDAWVNTYGVRYFSELTNTAVLMEEVGELARIMARRYGDQSFKNQDAPGSLADEIADVLFVLVCIANQTGVDLSEALRLNLEKKTGRDGERHKNNPKLTR